nr:unnamed protein product [Spirometra erinaceieuropaei]
MRIHESGLDRTPDTPTTFNTFTMHTPTLTLSVCATTTTTTASSADKKVEKINRYFGRCTRDVSTDASVNVSKVPLETGKYIARVIIQ